MGARHPAPGTRHPAPGTRLNIQETGGVIQVHPDDRGVFAMSTQGHVYLPLTLRRRCGLNTGDQVLLVVAATVNVLTIYPSAKLDALLADVRALVIGDER